MARPLGLAIFNLGKRALMRFREKVVSVLLLAVAIPAFAHRGSGGGLVRLEPIHQIFEDLDTWPLIINPKGDAERRINGTLNSFNAQTRTIFAECPSEGQWIREISVTMTGPHYLSLRARGTILCGGPRPDPYDSVLIFDLATGELLDGSTIVEKNSEIKVVNATKIARYPQSDKFLLTSSALDNMLMASANANCKESLQEVVQDPNLYGSILYSVWPDAKKNQIVVKPVSLSYLDYLMCAEEVEIPLDQTRKLGFTQSFLKAIEEAHRATLRP